jgi:hypothetical protein
VEEGVVGAVEGVEKVKMRGGVEVAVEMGVGWRIAGAGARGREGGGGGGVRGKGGRDEEDHGRPAWSMCVSPRVAGSSSSHHDLTTQRPLASILLFRSFTLTTKFNASQLSYTVYWGRRILDTGHKEGAQRMIWVWVGGFVLFEI